MNFFCSPEYLQSDPNQYIHRWSIAHFSWYYHPDGRLHWKDYIESQVFKPQNSELEFFMRLYPRGIAQPNNQSDHASLELHLKSGQVIGNVKLTFSLMDLHSVIEYHDFTENQNKFTCKEFVKHKYLDENPEYLLPHDTLTICCKIQNSTTEDSTNVIQGFEKSDSMSKPKLLSHDWTIEHFPDYLNGGKMSWKEELKSEKFSIDDSTAFYLSLYLNGRMREESNDSNHLSVSLHLKEQSETKFNYAFSLVDANGKRRNVKAFKNQEIQGQAFLEFISHLDLIKPENIYLSCRKLTIGVDIEDIENELIQELIELPSSITTINALSHIWTIEDITAYLNGGKMSWKECLNSQPFLTHYDNLEFYLSLRPNGNENVENTEHFSVFSVFLHLNKQNCDTKFNYAFSLVDANGKKRFMKAHVHNNRDLSIDGYPRYISHVDLQYWERHYLPEDKLTICVDIEDAENELIRGYTESCSSTAINALSHIWTIENFTAYLNQGKMCWKGVLYSHDFSTRIGETDFYLSLLPNGQSNGHLSVYLHSKNDENCDTKFNCAFSLFGENGTRRNIQEFKNQDLTIKGWGLAEYISHDDLVNSENNYLSQDKLTIAVDIEDCDENRYIKNELIQDYAQSSTYTKISGLSHIWTIENFIDYLNGGKMNWKKCLNSQPFSACDGNLEFRISLNPNGFGEENKDHISIFVHVNCDVKFIYRISIVDVNGDRRCMKVFKNRKDGLCDLKYISHVDLLNAQMKYLSENKLTICVDIEDIENEFIREYVESSFCTAVNVLSHAWTIEDFNEYLSGGKMIWKEELNSKPFKSNNGNLEFHLSLNPNENDEDENTNYLSIFLHSKKDESDFNYVLSLINSNGTKHYIKDTIKSDVSSNGYPKYILNGDLINSENNYLSQNKLTICVDIEDVGNEQLIQGRTESSSCTKVNALSHEWNVEDIADYFKGGRMYWKNNLDSRSFSTHDGKLEFYLHLKPNENDSENKDCLLVFLHMKNQIEIDAKFNYALSLVDANGSKRYLKVFKNHSFSKEKLADLTISHDDLMKNNYLSQNKLTISVDIEDVGNELIHGYTKSYSCTQVNVLSHSWTIEQFNQYLSDGKMSWKEELHSQSFSTKIDDDNLEFHLSLHPNGCGEKNKDHLSVFLHSNAQSDLKFNFAFSIVDTNGTKSFIKALSNRELSTEGFGYLKYIRHFDLTLSKWENNYLPDNKLTICVDIEDFENELIRGYTESCSSFAINAMSHIWTIEQFTHYLNCGKLAWKNVLNSQPFSKGYLEFQLSLIPNGLGDKYNDHLCIKLHLNKEQEHSTKFNYAFSLVDANGTRRNIKVFKNREFSKRNSASNRVYLKFISHADLLNAENNYLDSQNNKLSICFDIEDINCDTIRGFSQTHFTTIPNYLVHIWTIENCRSLFSAFSLKFWLKSYIESTVFSTPNRKVKFSLRLYPNGRKDNKFVSLYLHLVECGEPQPESDLKVSFAIFGDGLANVKELSSRLFLSDKSRGFDKFIPHPYLQSVNNGFMHDDKMTIYCGIENEELVCDYTETCSKYIA